MVPFFKTNDKMHMLSADIRNAIAMSQIFPGEVFANTTDFDRGIRQLLPYYDEMLDAITRCVPSTSVRILELGCGTGELSLKLLKRCPDLEIIALDYSPRMLKAARKKMKDGGYDNRWTGVEADFGEWANQPDAYGFSGSFDACVSSLAIHHLKDEMKAKLYQTVRSVVVEGGCFWNADPIQAESAELAQVYQLAREEWAARNNINLVEVRLKMGTSDTHGFSYQDQLTTLENQTQMLKNAGFSTVAIPWKYYNNAVFGGF